MTVIFILWFLFGRPSNMESNPQAIARMPDEKLSVDRTTTCSNLDVNFGRRRAFHRLGIRRYIGKNEWIPYLVDVQIKIKEWDWLPRLTSTNRTTTCSIDSEISVCRASLDSSRPIEEIWISFVEVRMTVNLILWFLFGRPPNMESTHFYRRYRRMPRRETLRRPDSIFGGRPNKNQRMRLTVILTSTNDIHRFISSIGLDESRLARQTEISVEVRASGSPVVVEFLVLAFVDICGKNESMNIVCRG